MTRRMIDPAFFESELVADLTMRQRVFVIGMIAIADDQGRMKGSARWLKSKIFPYDDISPDEIESDLADIQKRNDTIMVYDVGPRRYIQLVNWWNYQGLQWAKESKHPAPPEWADKIRQMIYKPKRWVKTVNWPNSEDKLSYDLLGNALGNELGSPLPISNTNTNTKIIKKKKALDLKFPASLDTESFRQMFEIEWVSARKEQKKPLTARAANLQLKELAKYPVTVAEAMVKQSIMNQWQGIFPLKNGISSNGQGNGRQPSRPIPESEETRVGGVY